MNVGIDIVNISRLSKLKKDILIEQILSPEEKEIFDKYRDRRALQFLAGRFAAKEAIIKALAGEEPIDMKDILVLNRKDGSPYVICRDYEIKVSISHENDYAVAIAMWV